MHFIDVQRFRATYSVMGHFVRVIVYTGGIVTGGIMSGGILTGGIMPRGALCPGFKIGTEVAHVTLDSDTTFKVKRSKVKVTRPLYSPRR